VRAKSYYIPAHSAPDRQRYFFAYWITIENQSEATVKLLSRHWVITDEDGKREEVRGEGVVGAQPVLQPGERFEYNSACPLPTMKGTMEGEFIFALLDEQEQAEEHTVEVEIKQFALDTHEIAAI
jgi:ApaG protein